MKRVTEIRGVMINYRVANLDRVVEQFRAEGVEIDERIEEYEYGRFAWIMDPDGNKIELWEPLVSFAKNPLDVAPAGLADWAPLYLTTREIT